MSINTISNTPSYQTPSPSELEPANLASGNASEQNNSSEGLDFSGPSAASSNLFFGDASAIPEFDGGQGLTSEGDAQPKVADAVLAILELLMALLKSLGMSPPNESSPENGATDSTSDKQKPKAAANDDENSQQDAGKSSGKSAGSSSEGSSPSAASSGSMKENASGNSEASENGNNSTDTNSEAGRPGKSKASEGTPASSSTAPEPAATESTAKPDLDLEATSGQGVTADKQDIRGNKGDDYHYQNNGGQETFTVSNTDKPAGEPYDPRSESVFRNESFKAGEEKTFSGKFTVESGDDTTIAQLLNHDENASDKHVPSAFINYEDGALYQGHKDGGQKLADIAPGEEFELTMKSNGESTDIYVNGEHAGVADGIRPSGDNYFKYGAYHHGGKDNDSVENKAVIHARDVSVS